MYQAVICVTLSVFSFKKSNKMMSESIYFAAVCRPHHKNEFDLPEVASLWLSGRMLTLVSLICVLVHTCQLIANDNIIDLKYWY